MPLFLKNIELTFYFSASLILMLISFLSATCRSISLDRINAFLVAIMMVLFYGLRAEGTSDIKMYLDFFDKMGDFEDFPWSYGFYVIAQTIKSINPSHEFYIFFTSLFFVFAVLICTFKYLKGEPYKSLLMLSFFNGWYILDLATNTIRQGMALPFVMLSFYFLIYGRKSLFLLFAALGISIHWGALTPLCFGVAAYFIAKRRFLLRSITIGVLLFYTSSYFINLDIARVLVEKTFIDTLQKVFVGVNLKSKAYAYLNSEIIGAHFYQLPIITRLKYTTESFIPLVVNAIFFLSRKKNDPFFYQNKLYLPVYTLFLLLTAYGVSIISMVWFFRNFYWGPMLSMISLMIILSYYKKSKNHNAYVFVLTLCVLIVGLLANWPSALLQLSYPA
ncbi:Uncharacterised protein [Serratia rubidaea]|uniref:EpsG family protein n=1 Tax=Serratia rubidaea TaxID=61652 RepID=UPI00092F7598|nr:EpsG family protein [Serratia rubidaea]QPR61686.1 EpsG family protein [Serratia rubidaea]CAI0915288.1 Uncharacterised protein [Serratia rubidaea]CAI1770529.1 Uncharacterised protein [Serratia rubidaea]HAY0636535.1 EpsG family protein [Serratia rubidaea]